MLRQAILLMLLGMVCSWLPQTSLAQPPASPFDTALFTAIRSGDLAALQQRLNAGSDANATQNGFSALMVATLAGTEQQMQLLLDRGAKPNYADADSITALWLAIPDPEKTILLLDHGADPNLLSKENYTPLVKLTNFPGTSGLFQSLVAKGADPKRAARDNTLLYNAAATNDTALVGMLLRLGFRPNDTVFNGDYPINSALLYSCSNTVKLLVDHGADVNVSTPQTFLPNVRGITCLMSAALGDDEASFFYLLGHGARVNEKSSNGYTTLMYVQSGEIDHPAMTKALLDRGATITDKEPGGEDAITLASKKGNTRSLQLLKQH
jgi:ankyrin